MKVRSLSISEIVAIHDKYKHLSESKDIIELVIDLNNQIRYLEHKLEQIIYITHSIK